MYNGPWLFILSFQMACLYLMRHRRDVADSATAETSR